jgi:hypothetical protein
MYIILKSLRTTNILLALLMGLLGYGAIVMPIHPSFKDINAISLFQWMEKAPLSASWWLYLGILTIGILVVNTVVCSIDSVMKKREGKRWLLTISPQVIHVGFCFIMVAHVVSSYGSFHKYIVLNEGSSVKLDSDIDVYLRKINYTVESRYITDMNAEIALRQGEGKIRNDIISPNNPAFLNGIGIYLKEIALSPAPRALIEFSHEPGALWALFGGVLFILGTNILVVLKLRDRSI